MNCRICGKEVVALTEMAGWRCPACRELTDWQCYDLLVGRIEGVIAECRVLCSEAHRSKDGELVADMTRRIADLERQRDGLRKPTTPRTGEATAP